MKHPSSGNDENAASICPKTGRRAERKRERRWASWALPFVGLVSLLWFLIRVIPKPSRATFPCQRAAFPVASGFVVWLTAVAVSSLAYCKANRLAARGRYLAAGLFLAVDKQYSRNLGRGEGIELVPRGGPDGDPDGDGMNNTTEYQAGTDPMDTNSTPFRLTPITRQGNDILIRWTTQGRTTNRVQVAPDIASGSNFTNLSPVVVPPGNYLASTNYLDIGGATNMPAKFYRVRLGP